MTSGSPVVRPQLSPELRERSRRERAAPRRGDSAWVHLRDLRQLLAEELGAAGFRERSLDLFCGTQPYRELVSTAQYVSYDLDDVFGAPTVRGTMSLPFRAQSFDLVLMTQALYFLDDDRAAIAEIHRVLTPGGIAIVTNPFRFRLEGWPVERRYGPGDVEALFGPEWASLRSRGVGSVGTGFELHVNRTVASIARRLSLPMPVRRAAFGAVGTTAEVVDRLAPHVLRVAPATGLVVAVA